MLENIINQVRVSFGKAMDKVLDWLDALINMLPNLFVAIIVVLLFYLLAKLARKTVIKLFEKTSDNTVIQILFSNMTYYLVLGIGIIIVLTILELQRTATSLLAGIGVLSLALALAFQEIVSNFIAGIILAMKKPFLIGHIIRIQDFTGIVQRTNLRKVVIKTFQGQEVYIPNRTFIQQAIVNYSILRHRRIDLKSRVSHQDDLELVKALILKTLKSVPGVIRKEEMIFTFTEFAESSIKFEI